MMTHFNFPSRPPEPVSPEDQALIDAAVAAGKVQRIPRGVSGLVETSGAWSLNSGSSAASKLMRRLEADARAKVIARLWNEGKTRPEIAKAVGFSSLGSVDAALRGLRAAGLIGRRR